MLSGCISALGGNDNAASPYSGIVTVRCSESCAGYGQCGALNNGNDVVLGRTDQPAVIGHDVTFPAGARANIQANETRTLINDTNGGQFDQQFYLVMLEDGSKAGWVAEWCLRPE